MISAAHTQQDLEEGLAAFEKVGKNWALFPDPPQA